MEPMQESFFDESGLSSGKKPRNKLTDIELDDLREYVDSVSFNLGKAYQHAKDRSRKQSQRNLMRKKIHHLYKNDKW